MGGSDQGSRASANGLQDELAGSWGFSHILAESCTSKRPHTTPIDGNCRGQPVKQGSSLRMPPGVLVLSLLSAVIFPDKV